MKKEKNNPRELVELINSYLEKNRKSHPVKDIMMLESARDAILELDSELRCKQKQMLVGHIILASIKLFDFFSNGSK